MIEELVIHIGDQKTGTTSIQSALTHNAEALRARGVLYPFTGKRINHRAEAMSLERGSPHAPRRDELWKRLATAARKAPAGSVLCISSERFELHDPRLLRAALEEHMPAALPRLRVAAYVRPHVARVTSSYAEAVKQGGSLGPAAAYYDSVMRRNPARFHFAQRFGAWRDVFGDALEVRLMHRAHLHGGDVVADFLKTALGGRAAIEDLDVADDANASLTAEELATLRVLHAALRAERGHQVAISKPFGWSMAPIFAAARAGGRKFALDRALAERIARDCDEDARVMDAEFVTDAPVMRELLRAAPAAAASEALDAAPESVLGAEEVGRLSALGEALRLTFAGEAPWQSNPAREAPFERPFRPPSAG